MGQSTEQLGWEIAGERQQLENHLHELEDKVKELGDWRTYFRRQPLVVLGAAFGGAVVLGLLSKQRSSTPAGFAIDRAARLPIASRLPRLASSADRMAQQAGDTWDHVADALLGVGLTKAVEYIARHVPGFREEYSRRGSA